MVDKTSKKPAGRKRAAAAKRKTPAKKGATTKTTGRRPSPHMLDGKAGLSLYREMIKIRRTEEQLARSYQAGLIPGACHTYIGEEAIARPSALT